MKKDRMIDLLREEQTPEAMARIMGNYHTPQTTKISNLIDKIKVTDNNKSKKTNPNKTHTYEQVQGDIERE